MGEGDLHNIVFTDQPFKRVSSDVTAFHRIQSLRVSAEETSVSLEPEYQSGV